MAGYTLCARGTLAAPTERHGLQLSFDDPQDLRRRHGRRNLAAAAHVHELGVIVVGLLLALVWLLLLLLVSHGWAALFWLW